MSELPRFDAMTLCPDYRFVRVVSKEGVFYDVVRKWRSREHIFRLLQEYPHAETVNRAQVPPCVFRDFTDLGAESYHESIWRNGTQLLFPLEAKDQLLLNKAGVFQSLDRKA